MGHLTIFLLQQAYAMFYKQYEPSHQLKPFIKCFWILEGPAITGTGQVEKILPDGCIEIIWHYGDAFKRVNYNGSTETQPGSFIIGQVKQYIQVMATGSIGVMGIRFYATGLAAFTNIPICAFTGQTVTLDNVFGKSVNTLLHNMAPAGKDNKVALMQVLLIKKLGSNKKYDFVIDAIVKKIILHNGQVSMHTLLKNFKISERHFERQFKKMVGVGPKFFARLTRFNSIMQAAAGNSTKTVSLTYLGGYYDEAHFIKDFTAFTGESPGSYFNSNHVLTALFMQV